MRKILGAAALVMLVASCAPAAAMEAPASAVAVDNFTPMARRVSDLATERDALAARLAEVEVERDAALSKPAEVVEVVKEVEVVREVPVEVVKEVEVVREVPAETLECGTSARPAVDQTPSGEWWAYCEPALIDVPEYPASIPACVSEDGSGGALPCVWDARARGNGEGRSFILWADDSQTHLD